MKKCVLLILSLLAAVPTFGQESGNRITATTATTSKNEIYNSVIQARWETRVRVMRSRLAS